MANRKPTLEEIEAALSIHKRNRLLLYYPETGPLSRHNYPKHMKFFAAGASHRERLFIAGNRVGKTEGVGAYETACHLTGLYPNWWCGRKFAHPIRAVAAGQTAISTRDIIQRKLLGNLVRTGSHIRCEGGMVPSDMILQLRTRSGVANAVEWALIRHASGGESEIMLKSCEQGPGVFAGMELHLVWFDEEPPIEVYTEALVRTMASSNFSGGIVMVTFTPLYGWTAVVNRFIKEKAPDRFYITATWDDAPHLSKEERQRMIESIPPHQREARVRGIPVVGSGMVYPIPEQMFVIKRFPIPEAWPRGYGLDVGWNATAAVWIAWDPDTDIMYVYDEYIAGNVEPKVHASEIMRRGKMQGVIDPAAKGRSQSDGIQLLELYRELGLDIELADNAVEAGVYRVWQRLNSGKLKVFDNLTNLLNEMRSYYRDENGKIIKGNDHLLDALRYRVSDTEGMRYYKPQGGQARPARIRRGPSNGPYSWMV